MRELRRPTMTAIWAWLLLAALGKCYGGEAGNVTFVIYNSTKYKVHARVIDRSSGTGSINYPAVPPNRSIDISFESGKSYALFFAIECSEDKDGLLKNCISGNCPEGGCNVEKPPRATTIYYNNGILTTSTVLGYNVALTGVFQCDGCDCSSISCIIPQNNCSAKPEEPGLFVACKVPSGQNCASSNSPPSAGAACHFKNGILRIKVSSPPKKH